MRNIIDNGLNTVLVPKEMFFTVQALDEKNEDEDEERNNDVADRGEDDETCQSTR